MLIVENILDMIQDYGEEGTQQLLSSFESPKNPEIETFLKKNAISFAQKKMSVTYLVSDSEDASILGYFTLANKALEIKRDAVSKNVIKKAERYGILDEEEGTYTIQSYLLAQFGKNYSVDNGKRIDATGLMNQVNMVIERIQHLIGGGFIYLDVEKNLNPENPDDKPYEKLVDIYRRKAGYAPFNERHSLKDGKDYIMMIKTI